jgi:iron-sulfur cluster assembly protein
MVTEILPQTTNAIHITPKAVERIRETLLENACQGGFRIGITGGGCSGMSYKFKLETAPRASDRIFEYGDVKVFIDPKSFVYLAGLTLDYTESLMERGFVFHNPNAKKSCSCGKSFQPNEV